MAIAFGSTIIFIYEGAGINQNINSFFDAVYWSVITISTVGFGDISPVTIEGKIATLFLVVGGLSVIAFFTSIVTTSLGARLATLKEEKVMSEANEIKDFIIICGYGQMGKVLADEFLKIKQKFIVVDHDNEMFANNSSSQILSIKGDATDSVFLTSIGINKGASTIIALTNDDAVNLSIILTARSANKNINIIARANSLNIKKKLLIAGANEVISANDVAALVAAEYIGQPIAFEAIDDILLNSENAIMDEVEIFKYSYFIGHYLKELNFDNYNLTLIGIIDASQNREFKFNPKKSEYIINESDIFIVIGYKESIINFKIDILSKKPKRIKIEK
jgi:voltage-gated potassium channel